MAKEEIKKLLENSKKELDGDYDKFVTSIKDDLKSSKKKALDKIWVIISSWFKYGPKGATT